MIAMGMEAIVRNEIERMDSRMNESRECWSVCTHT